MKLKLQRTKFTETATLGSLYVDGAFHSYTLEDKWRDLTPDGSRKVYGETCIPNGTYGVTLTYSPHFGRMLPELHDVPYFENIRLHGGNKVSDTFGCPLCGSQTNGIDTVSNCAGVVNSLIELIGNAHECTIEIVGSPNEIIA
jgi:hypothetical protein